jgi:DNA (cytosine-5)-methyltransferase 1
LEDVGYACGAADLCAAGLGAPHIRQRLFWVANANECGQSGSRLVGSSSYSATGGDRQKHRTINDGRGGGLANGSGFRRRQEYSEIGRCVCGNCPERRAAGFGSSRGDSSSCAPDSIWRDADWLFCRDGRWRPVEPGTFPLAHGVSNRVGRLRAYGNAIVPQVAATFIRAAMT